MRGTALSFGWLGSRYPTAPSLPPPPPTSRPVAVLWGCAPAGRTSHLNTRIPSPGTHPFICYPSVVQDNQTTRTVPYLKPLAAATSRKNNQTPDTTAPRQPNAPPVPGSRFSGSRFLARGSLVLRFS